MKTDEYKAQGVILFKLSTDGIAYQIFNRDWYTKDRGRYYSESATCKKIVDMMFEDKFTKSIYDLFDGKEFLKNVEDGCIIDYDGHIADIFVDGYVSNLGLATDNLTQGQFLVDADIWIDICNEFVVEVNWANK